jgi:hypothetical protein
MNIAKDMFANTFCLMDKGVGHHILSCGSCIISVYVSKNSDNIRTLFIKILYSPLRVPTTQPRYIMLKNRYTGFRKLSKINSFR